MVCVMKDEFDTANLLVKCTERYIVSYTDWRSIFGSFQKPQPVLPFPEPVLVEDTRDYLAAITGET